MKNPTLANLVDRVRAARRIVLLLHVSPDGDTCGSALALRRAFALSGKTVAVSCDHKIPDIYMDLDGAGEIVQPETLMDTPFDLAFAVDAADRQRLGRGVALFDAAADTVQIDHHMTNPGYAQANYVRSPLSATGVLALEVIDALGVSLDEPMAHCLFVAASTDTGNFKQENTDAASLRLAARCVEAGINPAPITRRVFDVKPLAQMKLIARALESLETLCDGRIATMRLQKQDFQETSALPEHTEGIVNYGINTGGVQMTCLFSQAGEKVKASLRSVPPYDVASVASALGGGGHARAAGCLLAPPMDEAILRMREKMIEEVTRHTI